MKTGFFNYEVSFCRNVCNNSDKISLTKYNKIVEVAFPMLMLQK